MALAKPKGERTTYVFYTNDRLHLFDVVETDLRGAWHRVKTGDGKLHVINPEQVLYIINETVV